MTDNKLTDNLANNSPILTNSLTDAEIIKALTICSTKGASGKDCPAFVKVDRSNCKKVLLGAIDIINRLQAEKQDLEIKLKAMRGAAISYKAENEMLKKDSKDIDEFARNNCKERLLQGKAIADFDSLQRYIKQQKAEAYKECIEKAKEYIDTHEHLTCEECECVPISKNGLDNLLKELVGEDK